MKFRNRALFAVLLSAVTAFSAYLENVPKLLTQPDGSVLRCLASGDEYHHWLHDKEGNLITRDPASGMFVYGEYRDGVLVPTDLVPGKDDPAGSLSKSVAPDLDRIYEKRAEKQIPLSYNSEYPAPSSGTLNNIVIFIRFSDQGEFSQDMNEYDGDFNSAEVSMKGFYQEASYGQLTVDTHFYPTQSGSYILSYQDTHPRSYYEAYDASTNTGGYQDDSEATIREHTLLKNAVLYVDDQIPSSLQLDGDNDGLVDNVCFVIQGGEEGWSDLLWPHMWVLWSFDPNYGDGSGNVTINGDVVWTYNFNLSDFSGNTGTGVGVLAHEMFHSLGAPDLYHYNYDGMSPVGAWDLMESNGDPPHHMLAYMKYRYGNWISSIPEISASGTYTLAPLAEGINCYKIPSRDDPNEYYMVEYRQKSGNYEITIPGTGLIVYRINSRYDGQGNASGPPDEVYVYRPGGTPSINGSVNSAHLSAETGRVRMGPDTDPVPFLSNGEWGGLTIHSVGSAGETITFSVNLDGAGQADLQPGSDCEYWSEPVVIADVTGENRSDTVDPANLSPGTYYINSAIQNAGDLSAVFLEGQNIWQVLLDGTVIQNWMLTPSGSASVVLPPLASFEANAALDEGSLQNMKSSSDRKEWLSRNSAVREVVLGRKTESSDRTLFTVNSRDLDDRTNVTQLFSEGFEGTFPGSWTLYDYGQTGDSWKKDGKHFEGIYSAVQTYNTADVETGMVSPSMDLSAYTGQDVLLSFMQSEDFSDWHVYHEVGIWVGGEYTAGIELPAASATWTEKVIDISAYAGYSNVQIEFYYYGNDADDWYIDKIAVTSAERIPEISVDAGTCLEGFDEAGITLEEGTHTLEIMVDPDALIDESDETNNYFSRILTVSGSSLTADFSADAVNGIVPFSVQFTDESSPVPVSWSWDLDGDGVEDAAAQNPSWEYTEPGTYTVTLKVTDADANTAEITQENFIRAFPDDGRPIITDLPVMEFPEDGESEPVDLDDYVLDPDTPLSELSFIFSIGESKGTGLMYRFDEQEHVITFSADPDWNGVSDVIMWVSDGMSVSSATWTVAVTPVNDPPAVSGFETVAFLEDSSSAVYRISDHVSDPDNEVENLYLDIEGASHVTVIREGDLVSFRAEENWNGQEILDLNVSDGELDVTVRITVVVVPVNDPPTPAKILFPADNSVLDTNAVAFRWDPSEDIDANDRIAYYECVVLGDNGSEIWRQVSETAECSWNDAVSGVYDWYVEAVDMEGARTACEASRFTLNKITSVDESLPSEFALKQNYPNPFNPETRIEYSLPRDADVTLLVYNIRGIKAASLVNGRQEAGYHSYTFRPEYFGLPGGIYFCTLKAGEFSSVMKMIYLK